MILGINPGRFGGGVTGIPFTDTKRLTGECEIEFTGAPTHELSSVFVYKLINEFGGCKMFYSKFYINSVCPLGFVLINKSGKEVNYNYYDDKVLFQKVKKFIKVSIQNQIDFGIDTKVCYCLGNRKNYSFLNELNSEYEFFENIIPLEHPRYIMQYKAKTMDEYVKRFLKILSPKQKDLL